LHVRSSAAMPRRSRNTGRTITFLPSIPGTFSRTNGSELQRGISLTYEHCGAVLELPLHTPLADLDRLLFPRSWVNPCKVLVAWMSVAEVGSAIDLPTLAMHLPAKCLVTEVSLSDFLCVSTICAADIISPAWHSNARHIAAVCHEIQLEPMYALLTRVCVPILWPSARQSEIAGWTEKKIYHLCDTCITLSNTDSRTSREQLYDSTEDYICAAASYPPFIPHVFGHDPWDSTFTWRGKPSRDLSARANKSRMPALAGVAVCLCFMTEQVTEPGTWVFLHRMFHPRVTFKQLLCWLLHHIHADGIWWLISTVDKCPLQRLDGCLGKDRSRVTLTLTSYKL
jgi:hypothetical protein